MSLHQLGAALGRRPPVCAFCEGYRYVDERLVNDVVVRVCRPCWIRFGRNLEEPLSPGVDVEETRPPGRSGDRAS